MEIDDENIEYEFILSACWDSGSIAAAYFNLQTLELHVS